MSILPLMLAAIALSGTTTRPMDSCYALGEDAEAVFEAEGLSPGVQSILAMRVDNAFGKTVDRREVPVTADADGRWKGTIPVPSARYGAFRVFAELDGAKLPQCGTRGAGYLTYAILPDPEKRPYLEPEDAFVGLHGVGPGQTRWLGARWSLERRWPTGDDGEFRKLLADRTASSWTNHYMITASRIFQRPGCFSEAGRAWMRARCKVPNSYASLWDLASSEEGFTYLAEAYSNLAHRACAEEDIGQRMHVYEIFWEPELHYPRRELLFKVARLAWSVITSVDPDAIIAAPTMHAMGFLDEHRDLFEKGLGEYMNAFVIHPYGMPGEKKNIRTIRALRRMVRDYTGRDLPRFSTEANVGATTDAVSERRQLDLLVRTMIVLLGEGYRFHHVFYGYDYGGDRADTPNGGCGLAYNIEYPQHRWAPRRLSPKPSFAGISAFSWLLDGSRPVVALDCFKDSRLGYVFADKAGKCTIALWDWGGKTSEMTVTTGRERTRVADIMGNEELRNSPGGKLKVILSSSPIYLVDVDPQLWGKDGSMSRAILSMPEEVADPVRIVRVGPTVTSAGPGVAVELENESGKAVEGALRTRIRGVPEARVLKTISVPAHARMTATVPFVGWDPDPLVRQPLEVRFDSTGVRAEARAEVGFFAAKRDYPGEPVRWQGGTIAAMWNAKGLFLDVTAPTNRLRMGFARMLVAKRTDNGFADIANQSAVEFEFASDSEGRVGASRTVTSMPERLPLGSIPARIRVDSTDGGVRYRVFLEWKTLNIPNVVPNSTVRLAFESGAARLFGFDGGVRGFGELILADEKGEGN